MPNLNQKGKIQLARRDLISMSTSGNGGYLKSLHKEGVLKILTKSKIEILNVVETLDLNSELTDPKTIGLMLKHNLNCTVDINQRTTTHLNFPTILQDMDGFINCYYPDESLSAMKQDGSLFPEFKLQNLNLFVSVDFMTKVLKENPAKLFKYRPRKRDVKIYNKSLKTACIDGGLSFFSFELNSFNLVGLSDNFRLILRDEEEVVLMVNEPGAPMWTERDAMKKLEEKWEGFVYDLLKEDKG